MLTDFLILGSQNLTVQEAEEPKDQKRRVLGVSFRKLLKNYTIRDMWKQIINLSKTALMKTEKPSPTLEEHRCAYFLLKPLTVQLQNLRQCEWTYSNQDNINIKESWGIAQLAECLPSRHKVLALIPSTT